jgi:uncharacterized protein GlcG (DUF336 family)
MHPLMSRDRLPSSPSMLRVCVGIAIAAAALFPADVSSQAPSPDAPILSASEVAAILGAAAASLSDTTLAVAVVDRAGSILGVAGRNGATPDIQEEAVSLARTGAFFSNDQAPLSSRTVRFISGIHFPPGVANTPNAALYGIENTNRGCQLDVLDEAVFNQPLPRPKSIGGTVGRSGIAGQVDTPLACRPDDPRGCSHGITTGKPDARDSSGGPLAVPVNPGGLPLYRNGRVIGGVGVGGVAADRSEFAALSGILGAAGAGITTAIAFPSPLPAPGAVFLDGLRLPFLSNCTSVACVMAFANRTPPGAMGGSASGLTTILEPRGGIQAPEGYIIGPRASATAGGLTAADVTRLVDQAVQKANLTRAQIRLPLGSTTRMIIAVSDEAGQLLAAFRMPDATMFSFDVSTAKARNAYYFSSRDGYEVLRQFVEANPYDRYRWEPSPPSGQGWALTNRTLSFGGQPLFPPGIDLTRRPTPGPWFDLFQYDLANPCTEGPGPSRGGDRSYLNQSGIVWFPGSAPLYKGGRLVGGIGASGDGVEQDDYVTAGAVVGFEPPDELRVDRSSIITGAGKSVRLPYWKFPRNPEIR